MKTNPHRWSISLLLVPGRAEMQFLHYSRATGTQCLDSTAWVAGPDIATEHAYLGELYQGVLLFQERRC